MSASLWQFQFSTSLGAPPTGSQLRFDAPPPYHGITRVWVRFVTNDGIDVFRSLLAIGIGTILYVQDKDDHEKSVELRVTAPAYDAGGYAEIPVEWIATTLPLTGQAVGLVITDAPTPVTPGIPPATRTLETLGNAKLQLGITDPARDAEVQLLLEHASAIVLDYIGARADPTWDAITAPDVVQRATLEMVAHLSEHRGDDVAPDLHNIKIWESLSLLLMRTRDPALA